MLQYADKETLEVSQERTTWKVNHESLLNEYQKLQKQKEDEIQSIQLDHKVEMQNAKQKFEDLMTKYSSVKDFQVQKVQLNNEIASLKNTIEDMQKSFKK